jgi:hypothetical protein
MGGAGDRKAVISIGLNVGEREPLFQDQLTELEVLKVYPDAEFLGVKEGVWDGAKERSVQYRLPEVSVPPLVIASLCRDLGQEAIAVLWEGCREWDLYDGEGKVSKGGSVEEFPVIEKSRIK